MEPEHEGLGEIEKLGARAIRPERRVSDEDLIASELASAVFSEPLNKIRHTVEALMLLDEGEREQAGITEEEAKEAEKLYVLARTLQDTHINREMDFQSRIMVDHYAVIPWPFPREAAGEWMGDWLGEGFSIHYYRKPSDETKEKLGKLPWFDRVHYSTSCLDVSMDTYKGIVIRFTNYAMPRVARLLKKIIHLVSPDSYKQALQLMRGGRRGKA